MMKPAFACAASALLLAACALPGQAAPVYLEAEAQGVERVRAYVRGGSSLLSF